MAVDDSYTKALLHMDGANGSTTFTDESGKTWTRFGDAIISTAQSVFGGASGYFDGTGDYISTPNSVDFNIGNGNFTVDFRMRTSSTRQSICLFGGEGSGGYTIMINTYAPNDGKIGFIATGVGQLVTDGGYNDGSWHHVAVVRNGNQFNIYVDGLSKASMVDGGTVGDPNGPGISIGVNLQFAGRDYEGYLDEYRFSKGIARWTAPFTPPTAPYGPVARISGATLLTEITPASFGKISGAMLLLEITDMPVPFGIIPTTLQARSTAATLRTKRKTYATLNERSTAITLEERP